MNEKNKSTPTNAKAIAYLTEVLRMNPVNSGPEIVSRRADFLNIRKQVALEDPQAKQLRRQRTRQQIDSLREQFWSITPEQLRAQVDAIRVRDFPEMQSAVDRLRLVSAFRTEFERLALHPLTQKHLFFHFKRIMMLPPREAGSVKEAFLRNVADRGSVKEIKAMVKMMKKEFPELYRAESGWLNAVAKTKDRSVAAADTSGGVAFELPIPGWLIGVVIIVIIRILAALAR
jgi:hypothetical protein